MMYNQPTRFVEPSAVVSHMHISSGEVVVDFGAGSGYFIPALAAAVGSEGAVYACEIQRALADTLGALARDKHLSQVKVVWGDIEAANGCNIKDNTADVGILINTLFQLEDKKTALFEILRIVRPGGRIYVIDWTDSFGGLGPQPQDIFSLDDTRALFESAGCIFENTFPAGAHHFGVAFRAP